MEKEAKRIVLEFYNLIIECGLVDTSDNGPFDAAKKMASKSVEMLIEANPTIESEPMVVGPMCIEETEMVCNKAHYKEVLKAIKNME